MKHIYTLPLPLRRTLSALVLLMLSTLSWADVFWGAYDFEAGDIYYNINDDGTSVTVISCGIRYSGDIVIPSTVTYGGKTYSVTGIGERAFYDCYSLASVSIGNGVTSIGDLAFYDCTSLATVICRAKDVPELRRSVFYNVPQSEATLYVPSSAIDDYKAADQWKDFRQILPLEEYETGIAAPAATQAGNAPAAPYYTPAGRRIAAPARGGIYIHGGRKLIQR